MNGISEKIGRRKVVISVLLVAVIAFSVAYALVQTKQTLAILTSPPPGIPGPYYVTAEAKIYGPVVDLGAIKSKTSGTYASDYTYVQWGTNPFYRVYVDNTLQEVYYGQMKDVMKQFSFRFAVETDLKNTYDNLKSTGALDPTSILGELRYFGNMPGIFIAYRDYHLSWLERTSYVNITSSKWYAVEAYTFRSWVWGPLGTLNVYLNETLCVSSTFDNIAINASSGLAGLYRWKMVYSPPPWGYLDEEISSTLYFQDLLGIQELLEPEADLRIYTVIDSPATAFVLKYVSPSSPVIGSPIGVTVKLDPPAAKNMNITDLYPNTFTWAGGQVTLQKFRIGVGLVETASVSVTPSPVGSNMQFTVYYNQATNVLESLLSDEYVYMSYTLTAPSTAGEYTLPSATMTYLIPLPQL